jgi:hypothetical protein
MHSKYPDLFETGKFLWYMFHPCFIGSVVEAAKFEDEFFLVGKN